jgi:DNA polymerase kappa
MPHRTFNPLEDKIEILRKLEEVAEELEDDMARGGWAGRTVTLKFKRSTFEGEERSGSSPGLRHPTPHLR